MSDKEEPQGTTPNPDNETDKTGRKVLEAW